MLEKDANAARKMTPAQKKAANKDTQISNMTHRIGELEMELEEALQNPPIPSKEKLDQAMKDDLTLIPAWAQPTIPVPFQTQLLNEAIELLDGILTNEGKVRAIVARLKKGIRTPPMGR